MIFSRPLKHILRRRRTVMRQGAGNWADERCGWTAKRSPFWRPRSPLKRRAYPFFELFFFLGGKIPLKLTVDGNHIPTINMEVPRGGHLPSLELVVCMKETSHDWFLLGSSRMKHHVQLVRDREDLKNTFIEFFWRLKELFLVPAFFGKRSMDDLHFCNMWSKNHQCIPFETICQRHPEADLLNRDVRPRPLDSVLPSGIAQGDTRQNSCSYGIRTPLARTGQGGWRWAVAP